MSEEIGETFEHLDFGSIERTDFDKNPASPLQIIFFIFAFLKNRDVTTNAGQYLTLMNPKNKSDRTGKTYWSTQKICISVVIHK